MQGAPCLSGCIVPVELCNVVSRNGFRADGLAFILVGAVSKALSVHGLDHFKNAAVFLRLSLGKVVEVRGLCADEKHGAGILTGRYACSASDAGSRIKSSIGVVLGDRGSIGIRSRTGAHGNETTGLNDAVEGAAVDHEVPQDRESLCSKGFDPDRIAVPEVAHVKLASSRCPLRSMRDAVDCEGAHATDSFPAVMVKVDRISTLTDDTLIDDVQHLEK